MTPVFTSKLNCLCETVVLAVEADHRRLATALQACSTSPVFAVGSGGSAVAAEFFAACRTSLGHPLTAIVTPMSYVLEAAGMPGMPTWLFSSSGENHDIIAAFDAASGQHGAEVDVLTSNPMGALVAAASDAGSLRTSTSRVHLAPVADQKDGFLATHSLVSAAASMMLAADAHAGALPLRERRAQLLDVAARSLSAEARTDLRLRQISSLADRDTLLLLHDPRLAAAAVLIETSFWEAGICAVQRTDFRNFAHGRHVWLARHGNRTFVLALTSEQSRDAWAGIQRELPEYVPSAHLDFGRAGRAALFEAVLSSLSVVEAAGALKGVDPGRPGVAEFGRRIFERSDLRVVVARDDTSTRRKRRAEAQVDPPGRQSTDWPERRDEFIADLGGAEIRALVLDYDGTVVATHERLRPPRADIFDALVALADHGVLIGFATGRGGSVGEVLRAHVPARLHDSILVGYYNGAHVVPLAIDIEKRPPHPDAAVAAIHVRLCTEAGLFVGGWLPKCGPLQITIPFDRLVAREKAVERITAVANALTSDGTSLSVVRVLRSGHSIDICPTWASKLRVVEESRRLLGDAGATVLCVGDSGDCQGNDHELLGGDLGLSVDRVCHRDGSCWNLLPPGISGPDGLVRVLSAIRPIRHGTVQLDVSALLAA